MSQPYQPPNSDHALQLARRCVSAITVKEFAIVISEANLTLNKQEWNRFIAECWRLKDESKQRGVAMNEERVEYHPTGHDGLVSPIDKIIASHRLARTIEAAHKSGVLLFLAAHLEPLLEEFHAKNKLLTTVELEVLMAVAARAMVSDQ